MDHYLCVRGDTDYALHEVTFCTVKKYIKYYLRVTKSYGFNSGLGLMVYEYSNIKDCIR